MKTAENSHSKIWKLDRQSGLLLYLPPPWVKNPMKRDKATIQLKGQRHAKENDFPKVI